MSANPYMPLFVDAYLADTTHLTAEESGAYLHILMSMWRHNGCIPDDDSDLCRISRVHPSRWSRVKSRILPFLTVTEDGHLTQKRLADEWNRASGRRAVNAQNGKLGGRPKSKEDQDLAKANGSVWDNPKKRLHTHTHTQGLNTETPYKKDRQKKGGADAPPVAYAFAGRVIRLAEKDFNRWRKAYHAIPDLVAELTKADDHYAVHPPANGKWFFPVSRWLDRAHNDALARLKPADPDADIYRGVI